MARVAEDHNLNSHEIVLTARAMPEQRPTTNQLAGRIVGRLVSEARRRGQAFGARYDRWQDRLQLGGVFGRTGSQQPKVTSQPIVLEGRAPRWDLLVTTAGRGLLSIESGRARQIFPGRFFGLANNACQAVMLFGVELFECAPYGLRRSKWTSRNAVKLGGVDRGDGWSVGLWPIGVSGSFDVPSRVLALDDSWAGTVTPFRVESTQELDDGSSPPVVVTARRGENRALVTASGG
jgi:hypothetical protein